MCTIKTTSHQRKELQKTQTLCVHAVEGSLWLKLWAWASPGWIISEVRVWCYTTYVNQLSFHYWNNSCWFPWRNLSLSLLLSSALWCVMAPISLLHHPCFCLSPLLAHNLYLLKASMCARVHMWAQSFLTLCGPMDWTPWKAQSLPLVPPGKPKASMTDLFFF